ncbi:uncharacterized protein LOC129586615 isoform X2 [Paramacrobiotus metropolitanus]|uniref:uncharacterized protein LOC129586615 isoform X2 n=1 Tax=Paramacrobiotus metropolitanus TaxID=2943436 RepID=UPI002446272B|nr:uncharacterized protein LOC129586615 isoform X2 [Paramacrobiotus metropolitanus]
MGEPTADVSMEDIEAKPNVFSPPSSLEIMGVLPALEAPLKILVLTTSPNGPLLIESLQRLPVSEGTQSPVGETDTDPVHSATPVVPEESIVPPISNGDATYEMPISSHDIDHPYCAKPIELKSETAESEKNSIPEAQSPETEKSSSSSSTARPASVKTELSELIKEIHSSVFEEHKTHPSPVWAKRKLRSCYVDDRKSVPTCADLLDAYEIDAFLIPEMSVQDVAALVLKLFGPKRKYLSKIFEDEMILRPRRLYKLRKRKRTFL